MLTAPNKHIRVQDPLALTAPDTCLQRKSCAARPGSDARPRIRCPPRNRDSTHEKTHSGSQDFMSTAHSLLVSGLNLCVVESREANKYMMASKLAAINCNWNVQFHRSAEQVMHNLEGIDILIVGQLDAQEIHGLQFVQLVRNHYCNDIIIILCSDDMEEDPGANLMWSEDISMNQMVEDLRHIATSQR